MELRKVFRPVAIGLVTSGSRGNRLVFYHKGIALNKDSSLSEPNRQTNCSSRWDVMSVLPPTTLAEILAPSSLMVDRKFELTVDHWKFVGHPFFVQNGTFSITFNVVFVLESFCTVPVVEAYDHLSHLIGSALVHEEVKCGFLCQEVKILMQVLEEADIPNPSAGSLLEKSSLAQSLALTLQSLQKGSGHVQVKLNNWSEVNTLLKVEGPTSLQMKVEKKTHQTFNIRSYSALLLLESANDIVATLPPSSNPAMQRMLSVVSPLKNLQTVSQDADIPLMLVLHLASHLVHWGKAMAVYPLSENNVYITSPTADTQLDSELSVWFTDKFPDQSLPDVLANFSLPVPLSEIKEVIEDERVVIWLLQHKQIVQLHTYVYIVPNEVNSSASGDAEQGKAKSSNSDDQTKSQLLDHLTPVERRCVLQTSAAADTEDLEQFARFSQYFHGNHHLEGIMLMENTPRSQLLILIDKFSEVLVTCTLPEHSIPSMAHCL